MSHLTRKFIAVFMLLWLPLFSASAVAESLAMQLQHGDCQDAPEMMDMSHHDMTGMSEHHMTMAHDEDMQAADDSSANCASCEICHIACSAYIGAPATLAQLPEAGSQPVMHFPEHFSSHDYAPLDPPPLARA